MRWYKALLIITILMTIQASAATFNPDDIEFAYNVTGTLHRGGTLTNGEYMVKAVQFPAAVPGVKTLQGDPPTTQIVPETDVDPMVYLELYKNGVLQGDIVLTLTSGAYVDPDYEVEVSATAFTLRNAKEWVLEYYDPWATVTIRKRAHPKLEVTISTTDADATEKSTFTSNDADVIKASVNVKNTGETFIKKVDVDLKIGELQLRGGEMNQLHMYFDRISKDEIKNLSVVLLVPDLTEQRSYPLNATAKGYDVKDIAYNASGSKSILVVPNPTYFSISKSVRDRIYLQDDASVRIVVANGGMYDISDIHIKDNMSSKFVLSSSPISFEWDIPLLKSGEEWSTGYSMKPTEANINGWKIPAANATFTVNNRQYSNSSPTITLIVNGPRLLLNKTVSKPVVNMSEDVIVTVSANNIGNIGTKTDVIDSLPDSVSLVSGQLSQLNFSEAGKTWGFSYIIRMNKEGDYELPPAIANYTNVEYRGTVRDVESSQRPIITVIDPSKPRPTNSSTNGTASKTSGGKPSSSQGDLGGALQSPGETATGTATATPITPGFEIAFAVVVLVFTAGFIRR
ncbi:Uncharacterised protein [uncultured archaeon]|nr:Uncharacterised protein [uncultured archaeon]